MTSSTAMHATMRGGDGSLMIRYGRDIEIVRQPGPGEWPIPAGVTEVEIIATGGGGGASLTEGGAPGHTSPVERVAVNPGDCIRYHVGTGGGPGQDGGDTWFEIARGENP